MMLRAIVQCAFLVLVIGVPGSAQNLVKNGTFDDPAGAFTHWTTDYTWTGNSKLAQNKEKVVSVENVSGRRKVAHLVSNSGAGVKIESRLIPFEQGQQYTANLDVKGGPVRIYFAGYRWKPGIRPHDQPKLEDLRMVYKSKAHADSSGSWDKVRIQLPGVKASTASIAHLKQVKFITLYIWAMEPAYVDNVQVTKQPYR